MFKFSKRLFISTVQSLTFEGDNPITETVPITMSMEAGREFYTEHSAGVRTIHAGVGWIQPFGRASYVAGIDYPEAEGHLPTYMNDEWMDAYGTRLFCIYTLDDEEWEGSAFYAWDGIVGNLAPYDENLDDGKSDYLINVIVGGTGIFEDATGLLVGYTLGRGSSGPVDSIELPDSILKLMEGYVNIQINKNKVDQLSK